MRRGVARSRDILVYNGGYGAFPFPPSLPGRASVHAKEISFTFYDELVIMPYAGLENGGLAWCIFSFLGWTTGHVEQD